MVDFNYKIFQINCHSMVDFNCRIFQINQGRIKLIDKSQERQDLDLTNHRCAPSQDVYLDEEFDRLLEEVREVKPDIQIISNLRPGVKDPLSVVKNFVSNNQDQWMEFCQQFDSDGALKITRTDFIKCLKVCR